jgi:hypothetical protein
MVKFVEANPRSDPETAARKLIQIANGVEAVQDGRIHIEKVNGPFLFEVKGTTAQYRAGLNLAIERGWIVMHESGTYLKFTQAGADLFA